MGADSRSSAFAAAERSPSAACACRPSGSMSRKDAVPCFASSRIDAATSLLERCIASAVLRKLSAAPSMRSSRWSRPAARSRTAATAPTSVSRFSAFSSRSTLASADSPVTASRLSAPAICSMFEVPSGMRG